MIFKSAKNPVKIWASSFCDFLPKDLKQRSWHWAAKNISKWQIFCKNSAKIAYFRQLFEESVKKSRWNSNSEMSQFLEDAFFLYRKNCCFPVKMTHFTLYTVCYFLKNSSFQIIGTPSLCWNGIWSFLWS